MGYPDLKAFSGRDKQNCRTILLMFLDKTVQEVISELDKSLDGVEVVKRKNISYKKQKIKIPCPSCKKTNQWKRLRMFDGLKLRGCKCGYSMVVK